MKKIRSAVGLILSCSIMFCLVSCSFFQSNNDVNSSNLSSIDLADSSSLMEQDSSKNNDLSSEEQKTPSDITPAMWRVTDKNGTTMTLIGSMHALRDNDYPLPDKIMEEYNNADVLAVECDALSYSKNISAQLSLAKDMYYSDEITLEAHISKEAYECVKKLVESYGYDMAGFDKMKPWAVEEMLSGFLMLSSKLNSEKGFDSYFLERYKEDGKELYEVESVEFQLDLLRNLPNETYETLFLCYKNQTKDSQVKSLLNLYKAWRTGDISKLEEMMEQDDSDGIQLTQKQEDALEDYTNQMYYNRNKVMEKAIEKLLNEKKKAFYVVGAAHFVGEDGIIDLLEKNGYDVEQIKY